MIYGRGFARYSRENRTDVTEPPSTEERLSDANLAQLYQGQASRARAGSGESYSVKTINPKQKPMVSLDLEAPSNSAGLCGRVIAVLEG